MKKRIFKNFRNVKLVTCDVSRIMNFFIEHPKENANFFVFFHKNVPIKDHEEVFKEYIKTLPSMLNTYCSGEFEVSNCSYESYLNEIQVRYCVNRM